MGHINNAAIVSMFETGRTLFHRHLSQHPREMGVRWLVAAVSANFVQEMHFPTPVEVAVGFGGFGRTSWTLLQAAFQDGECCATCETVIVAQGPDGRRQVGEELRARMADQMVRQAVPA